MGEVVLSAEEQRMEAELGAEEETGQTKKATTVGEEEKKDGSSAVVDSERFLPRMMLRVLLVEADDSTRHIISALLRKCNYRVSAVSDGLMAWETLKGGPHNIDLILTEVELPSISGYALLTLVMEHDICKNIPVIMMSSQDSISMVLKCMLQGAADFLIKPVRRNELKNLWQHVWRRQTLTAGHIPQNSYTAQQKLGATSENNAASNHSSYYATSSQKNKSCSEKGSDTESSCTSPYLEAESAHIRNMQGLSQLKGRSTSNLSNKDRKQSEEHVTLDGKFVMPESKSEERSNKVGPEGFFPGEAQNETAFRLGEEHTCVKAVSQHHNVRPENNRGIANVPHGHKDELVEPYNVAIDLIGAFDSGSKCNYNQSILNDGIDKLECIPHLELSLRRSYPSASKNQVVDERQALNHSNASAFSWYNSKTLQPLFPTSTRNYAEFKEVASKSVELPSNQVSWNINGVTEEYGATMSGSQGIMTTLVIGQSRQAELAYPSRPIIPVSGVRFDNICSGSSHVFPPVYDTPSGVTPAWSPKLVGQREESPFHATTSVHSNPEIHDFEHNYRQSNDTTNNYTDQNEQQHNNKEYVDEQRYASPATGQSSTSSLCNGVANDNNSSAYGSFCAEKDKNGNIVTASDKTTAPDNLNDGGLLIHDGFRGLDSRWPSQREAALAKFRMKRKERCYEKKVRYQSRKRLAEQRPRVKGQFVRQVQNDPPIGNGND